MLLVPSSPGNASIAGKLVEHLSLRFPDREQREFHLEYRLFSDTSSQLPGTDASQRRFTYVLASSHDPGNGYLRVTKPGAPDEGQSITIAAESIESFTTLTLTKLQPLWYHRQHLVIEDGISVSIKDNEWIISIGDVKVAPKSPNAGQVRGTVIELHRATSLAEDEQGEEQDDQLLFQDVLNKIFEGFGEHFNNAKIRTAETLPRSPSVRGGRPADWQLASMYMDVLRGQR